jgi:selenide,water dikinase
MVEAGCTVIGGHSIRDEETKFGYAVTGMIDPRKILANQGAKPGDSLVLTKALGTGVISTAIKKGVAERAWVDAAIQSMTTLNKRAAELISDGEFGVHAMTDVTGFGLIGHARELAFASGVALRLSVSKIPLIEGAVQCVRNGHIPGGLTNNRDFAECQVQYDEAISEDLKALLFDPQTAGGLLVSATDGSRLSEALNTAGIPAAQVGAVLPNSKPCIQITR